MEHEDKEFEALLADKRHKELVGALREILSQNKDKGVSEAIKALSLKLDQLKPQPFPIIPVPQVNVNQAEVVKALAMVHSELKKYNDRPMVKRFDMEYRGNGFITSINVVYDGR